MDVKVMAFEISLGNGISMSDLRDYIMRTSSRVLINRMLYICQIDGWLLGVVLTSKNIKTFSKLVKEGGIVRLSPQTIDDGELAHFNFFLLNPMTGRGYFQYYHGSATIYAFFDLLKKRYGSLKEDLISIACRELEEDPSNPPASIRRRFKGRMECNVVLRTKTFEQLMDEISYIKNIKIQFLEYIPDQPLFRALATQAKRVSYGLSFRPHGDRSIIRDIIALSRGSVLKDLRGVGVGTDAVERPFHLITEPETLDRFDFNDMVLETQFDSQDISQSLNGAPVIGRLRQIEQNDNGWASGVPR